MNAEQLLELLGRCLIAQAMRRRIESAVLLARVAIAIVPGAFADIDGRSALLSVVAGLALLN